MTIMNTVGEELPDDYFTPTLADIKVRQQQLHARTVSLNNAPLLTRAQREEQAKMKRDRWPNVRPPFSVPLIVVFFFGGGTCQSSHVLMVGLHRPRSGYAFPISRSLKRCSRRAARFAPYMRLCEIRCVRTSSLSNSSYVRLRLSVRLPVCPSAYRFPLFHPLNTPVFSSVTHTSSFP